MLHGRPPKTNPVSQIGILCAQSNPFPIQPAGEFVRRFCAQIPRLADRAGGCCTQIPRLADQAGGSCAHNPCLADRPCRAQNPRYTDRAGGLRAQNPVHKIPAWLTGNPCFGTQKIFQKNCKSGIRTRDGKKCTCWCLPLSCRHAKGVQQICALAHSFKGQLKVPYFLSQDMWCFSEQGTKREAFQGNNCPCFIQQMCCNTFRDDVCACTAECLVDFGCSLWHTRYTCDWPRN